MRPLGKAGLALAASFATIAGCTRPAVPVEAEPAATAPPVLVESGAPVERAWPVMGTMLYVSVWDADEARAVATLREARAAVMRVDSLMSNYRDDSDVSRVNRAAGSGTWVSVSSETIEVLTAALAYARESAGAFDPTIGPVVDVWGFYRERGAMPELAALDSARALTGWHRVEIDGARVRLPRAGMRLDFGAIAKGHAVDRALQAARRAGATRLMVDLGGNIGVLGRAPDGDAWSFGLAHPRDPESPFAVMRIEGGAIATSGDYERFFMHDGVRYAHIVDPRSGWPVNGVASVSVWAPSGIESDGWSTTLFVLGREAGCAAIRGRPGIAAVWVLAPEESQPEAPLRVVVGGEASGHIELASDVIRSDCAGGGR